MRTDRPGLSGRPHGKSGAVGINMILDMHDTGMSAQEIARQLSLNVKTVQAYLPRVRPVYGENKSENAKRIKEWRDRKKK